MTTKAVASKRYCWRISTASGSERDFRRKSFARATLATARGTDLLSKTKSPAASQAKQATALQKLCNLQPCILVLKPQYYRSMIILISPGGSPIFKGKLQHFVASNRLIINLTHLASIKS